MTPCQSCDGQMLKQLAQAGKNWLEINYQRVNELNVFPVPDGDTGTNMLLTMRNAYQEVSDSDSTNAGYIAKRLAHGAIMGSRGNSGTIMSQIWSGFAQALGEAETFDVSLLKTALQSAADKAYQGVQKPVEGTILTVIREIATAAQNIQTRDLREILDQLVKHGWQAVEQTPELLPILKQAKVVDSGGTGLMYVLEGMLKFSQGEAVAVIAPPLEITAQNEADLEAFGEGNYNYDVQFILRGENLPVEKIRADIEAMGDSGVIIGTDTLIKVHIHVDNPILPMQYALQWGQIDDGVIENMQHQFEARRQDTLTFRPVNAGEIAVIAVASGQGLKRLFADLGVTGLVEGGQTNNPSTADILAAAQATQAENIIILPNNKNIQLAAQQAAQHADGFSLHVLPTRSIPQGIAAMVEYQAKGELEEVLEEMTEAADEVLSIEVTFAVRSVEIDGVMVAEGQTIGLVDGKLQAADESPLAVLQTIFAALDLEEYELVTLYYGEKIPPDDAQILQQALQDQYQDLTFEALWGGQPHYSYIVSVE